MTTPTDRELQERLTGYCPYLTQPPPYEAGDEVSLTFRYDEDVEGAVIPLNASYPNERPDSLGPELRTWGETVVLVRATLAETGGQPRDSMNQPTGDYDPEALTLSDVTVVDRSPPWDAA